MNDLQEFNFDGNNVRVITINGDPWWVLKDVCDVLGIDNQRNVAAILEDDEKDVHLVDTLGGDQSFLCHETIRDTVRIWCLRKFCSLIETVKGKKEV